MPGPRSPAGGKVLAPGVPGRCSEHRCPLATPIPRPTRKDTMWWPSASSPCRWFAGQLWRARPKLQQTRLRDHSGPAVTGWAAPAHPASRHSAPGKMERVVGPCVGGPQTRRDPGLLSGAPASPPPHLPGASGPAHLACPRLLHGPRSQAARPRGKASSKKSDRGTGDLRHRLQNRETVE